MKVVNVTMVRLDNAEYSLYHIFTESGESLGQGRIDDSHSEEWQDHMDFILGKLDSEAAIYDFDRKGLDN